MNVIIRVDGQHKEIADSLALAGTLSDRGIPTDQYGNGITKSMEQLFREIQGKESAVCIDNDTVLRVLNVLNINIYSPDESQQLGEFAQVKFDGNIRRRTHEETPVAVSEKLAIGEDIIEGAVRAVREELTKIQSNDIMQKVLAVLQRNPSLNRIEDIDLLNSISSSKVAGDNNDRVVMTKKQRKGLDIYKQDPIMRETKTYPGIINQTTVFDGELILTPDQFDKNGYYEIQPDKGKLSLFTWKDRV